MPCEINDTSKRLMEIAKGAHIYDLKRGRYKTKRERGLCDVVKCYREAAWQWTTGGGSILYVCEEHDKLARKQMGSQYFTMKPTRLKKNT